MIGWLSGQIVARADGTLTVNVGGVGYDVIVPGRLFATGAQGDEATLFVHTSVREDAITLYGFESEEDRSMFRLLLSTPGVGPATALGALSTMSIGTLIAAIYAEDTTTISTIPGIGKKTAARLILELAGRLPQLEGLVAKPVVARPGTSDLEAALKSLGYGVAEIREALSSVDLPDNEADALRVALRQLGTR